ncbi:retrovirus-related pol polyprotein from transposon TNT 1-94, partial [Tanacetum coccineum]
ITSILQCFNCKEFGHYAKECRKPKRVKDSTYHKENMLLYKQAEKGVQLQAEQSDWLADTDEEIDEQELEIQDLKAQLQDKNMAISELKKLVAKCKGKSVDTKYEWCMQWQRFKQDKCLAFASPIATPQ